MNLKRLCFIVVGLTAALAPYARAPPPVDEPKFSPGIEVTGMDRSVSPGANFFAYTNGTWLRTNEIPSDLSTYGSWDMLKELGERRVANLIQQQSEGTATAGSEAQKISDYFESFLQEDRIEDLEIYHKIYDGNQRRNQLYFKDILFLDLLALRI